MLESILEPFRDTSSDLRVPELNSDLRTPAPDALDRVACSIHEAHSIYTVVDSLIYTFLLPSVPRASLSASETRTSTPRCCRTRSANTETWRLRTTQPPFRCYTGAIISGSSVLQVFVRVQYEESDLDLYVEESKAHLVSLCLKNLGYSRLVFGVGTKDSLDPGDGYPGKTETKRVDTFVHQESRRIVQLINTVREPIFAILQFHSSTYR